MVQPVTLKKLMFGQVRPPQRIEVDSEGTLKVPSHVVIPFIEGDGIGPEIMKPAQQVVNMAVRLAYGLTRSIQWLPLQMGEKALAAGKKLIPDETIEAIKVHRVAVKGPVNTPIGGGFRSVNVELRKIFNLFANVRPVKFLPGVVTPLKKELEDKVDMVIFRENTEDVYAGIEFEKNSIVAKIITQAINKGLPLVNKTLHLLTGKDTGVSAQIPEGAGIGFKPVSEAASKQLIRQAIQYAIDHQRPSVTLVGKGNIMKHTEGAFLKWGYEVAKQEFPGKTVTSEEFAKDYNWDFNKLKASGKVLIQERLTDNMFQEVVLKPDKHSVIATTNLNGDYLSDAVAATVGGLGVAPGANIGKGYAVFESVHGSAPDIAGKNIANPTALMLSMAMMLDYIGWKEAASKVRHSVENTLAKGKMTGDLAVKAGVPSLSTTDYTQAVIDTMIEANKKDFPNSSVA